MIWYKSVCTGCVDVFGGMCMWSVYVVDGWNRFEQEGGVGG